MKIWHSKYTLDPVIGSSKVNYANEGVLLKYEDDTYSLYHPITSLGDLSLDDFIESLKTETELNKRVKSLRCSETDFSRIKLQSQKCYYSAPSLQYFLDTRDELWSLGFTSVKIKVSSFEDIKSNLKELNDNNFKYIFDFNGRGEKASFDNSTDDVLNFLRDKVLYLEDPSRKAPALKEVLLASDFIDYKGSEDIKVIKPTGFNHIIPDFVPSKTVVTSYLDHPLGQMISALWAFNNGITLDCGLHSHTYYALNKYSELFSKSSSFKFEKADAFFKILASEDWCLV